MYSHAPESNSFKIGSLVIGAPAAYEMIYPIPIIKPELFDCAFEIDYQGDEENPHIPNMMHFYWRQAETSSFLSVPAGTEERLSFDQVVTGWPISYMRVRYLRGARNEANVTQSSWPQENEVTVTPVGVSVVAHVVTGLETVLGKIK
jgi:hypothetical protein